MSPYLTRKTEALRLGRVSIPQARYFVTACACHRAQILHHPVNANSILNAVTALERHGDLEPLAITVMPDHVHLLFQLGERLSLDRVMAKFKNLARVRGSAWRWQANSFERRLRPEEMAEDYAFYIFMNPYKEQLITTEQTWPWWRGGAIRWEFEEGLDANGCPPPEWLGILEKTAKRITIGGEP